jgi:hypothetical protein
MLAGRRRGGAVSPVLVLLAPYSEQAVVVVPLVAMALLLLTSNV